MARVPTAFSKPDVHELPEDWETLSDGQRRAWAQQFAALVARGHDPRELVGSLKTVRRAQETSDDEVDTSELEPGLPTLLATAGGRTGRFGGQDEDTIERPPYLDEETRDRLREIVLYNHDASYALYIARRMALRGLEWEVVERLDDGTPGTESDPDATAYVSELDRRVASCYEGGGLRALVNVAFGSIFEQGAGVAELDVADSLDDVLDIVLSEPSAITFVRDPEAREEQGREVIYPAIAADEFGGDSVPLNTNQVRYLGLDARVSSPYGTPVILPALDTAWPQTELRDALHQLLRSHAFSKPEVTVISDKVLAASEKMTPQARRKLLEDAVASVKASVERARHDDTWIHTDVLESGVMTADHSGSSWSPEEWSKQTDQDQFSALKALPQIMGRAWGNALSSVGAIEWKVYVTGVESVRDASLDLIAWAVNQSLRIAGYRGVFRFKPQRIEQEDRVAEARADLIERQVAQLELDVLGIVTREELRFRFYGDELPEELQGEAAEPEPEPEPEPEDEGGEQGDEGGEAPEDGEAPDEDEGGEPEDGEEQDGDRLRPDFGWTRRAACEHCADAIVVPAFTRAFEPKDPSDYLTQVQASAGADVDEDDIDDTERWFDRLLEDEGLDDWEGIFDATPVDGDEEVELSRAVLERELPAGWTFDIRSLRYRRPRRSGGRLGELVPQAQVNRLFERVMDAQREAAKRDTDRLISRRITVAEWQRRQQKHLKRAHITAQVLGAGGRSMVSQSQWGRAGGLIARDYRALGRFGEDIVAGRMSEAQIRARIGLYSQANLRRSLHESRREGAAGAGYQLGRRVLSAAEHCPGCAAEAARGWIAIAELTPLGSHECGPNDRCSFEFRYSTASAVPRASPLAAGPGMPLRVPGLMPDAQPPPWPQPLTNGHSANGR